MNSAATIEGMPVRMSTMNEITAGQPAAAVLDQVDRSEHPDRHRIAAVTNAM